MAEQPPKDRPVTDEDWRDLDPDHEDDEEYFDPDRDSVADVIKGVEEYCQDGWNDLWAEALAWLRETVALDFEEIQSRWREFPVIIVPQHVSDRPDPAQPHRLFGYLNQIRLAYIIGADLAAIALCRATTELLIQDHYPSDQKKKGDLSGLIRSVQSKFAFLKQGNLIEKVRQANNILHASSLGGSAVDTLPHQNPARGLGSGCCTR
jgi:hypothetical protein